MCLPHRVPVSPALKERISEIKADNDWRIFNDQDWWLWSHTLAWKIANGKSETVAPAVYEAVNLDPPAVFQITLSDPRIAVFGDVGLLQASPHIVIQIISAAQADCQICSRPYVKWPPNRKYCDPHSYATPEGRRYWRRRRKTAYV